MCAKKRSNAFRPNDLDYVYYSFFQDVWDSGDVYADPSGWRDTESITSGLLPSIKLDETAFGRYYLDEGDTLGIYKQQVTQLMSAWESRSMADEELTLYNSVSTANAAVLIALKRLGAKTVIFETPAYGVTINQARHSGFKVILAPTYQRDNFALTLDHDVPKSSRPIVLWLTQPRMSLGYDQQNIISQKPARRTF